jgi:uncharacterized protein YecT (DUF1311 family)
MSISLELNFIHLVAVSIVRRPPFVDYSIAGAVINRWRRRVWLSGALGAMMLTAVRPCNPSRPRTVAIPMKPLSVVVYTAIACLAAEAKAEAPRPADREQVEACLALVRTNADKAAREATARSEPERAGPSGRLADAARDATLQPESCIGVVANPCIGGPELGGTQGEAACSGRELAVWDERLNQSYRAALDAAAPAVAEGYRAVQRAWIQYRDARCQRLVALETSNGSMAVPLSAACLLDLTARQALWLEAR